MHCLSKTDVDTKEEHNMADSEPRHDVRNRTSSLSNNNISVIFCLLGIGSLLPWNAFINADEYFQSRLCSGPSSNGGGSVELWFGLIFNVLGALALGVLLVVDRYQEKRKSSEVITQDTGTEEESHSRQMVYYSLSSYLFIFLITTALVLVPRVPRSLFLSLTLSGIGICGASMAVTGAGVTAVAAMFPPSIGISSYFSGQAIGGLSVAVANLMAALAESPTKFHEEHCKDRNSDDGDTAGDCPVYETDLASFSYFSIGCLFLLGCLLGFHQLNRHILDLENQDYEEEITEDGDGCNVSDEELNRETVQDTDSRGNHDLQQPLLSEGEETDCVSISSLSTAWSAIRLPALSVFMTLFVVIVITPSWVVNIRSTGRCSGGRLQNDLFAPILFVVFNAGDLTGRTIAGRMGTEKIEPKQLFAGSIARIAFLPLFLLCPTPDSAIPVNIDSDAYTILLVFFLAVTNGFVMNMSFMLFPRLLPDNEYLHEIGSTIMNFSLSLGLLLGSFFSFGFVAFGTSQR